VKNLSAGRLNFAGREAATKALSCTFCSAQSSRHEIQERTMDWDRIEGNWKQFSVLVKEKWGILTDDEIAEIEGKRDRLEGKIQERYGYTKDQVRQEVDDWLRLV
jgi:uncharacterized protein YjbJ (UPF0337 family)